MIRNLQHLSSYIRTPDDFATSVEFRPEKGLYIYTLLLTEAESNEVTRLSRHGYDCELVSAACEVESLADGMVAYRFTEGGAHEVYEAYSDLGCALATCGMQSLLIKVQQFIEAVV